MISSNESAERCAPATRVDSVAPSLASSYTAGWLTGLTGYASAIGYHPDGSLARVAHANGIDDVRSRDPVDWSPLHSITAGSLWSSGPYDYDDSGNIVAIGDETYRYDHLGRLVRGATPHQEDGCERSGQSAVSKSLIGHDLDLIC